MINIENTDVSGWEAAIRGLRNPMNSWDRSDSQFYDSGSNGWELGDKDKDLMFKMNASTEQSKYRRMITVTCDITAPLYWWKEADTYKVGTVSNSCSTMHKIHAKKFEKCDFSHEHLIDDGDENVQDSIGETIADYTDVLCDVTADELFTMTVRLLNAYRERYIDTKDKKYWWQMIQLLPSSYNQRRTWQANYEVLAQIYRQRQNHKLDEWHAFCDWIKSLPHYEIIIGK